MRKQNLEEMHSQYILEVMLNNSFWPSSPITQLAVPVVHSPQSQSHCAFDSTD